MDTDYIDLLLLYQPAGDYITGYKMMEKAVKEGKVKSIGISNFYGERLENLLNNAEIKPSVTQVETHPYYPQTEISEEDINKIDGLDKNTLFYNQTDESLDGFANWNPDFDSQK